MAKPLYLTVKAVCHICSTTNRRGLNELASNRRCSGCHATLATDAWYFPDGVRLADAMLTITCPSCGTDFEGELWKTLCTNCYIKAKQGTTHGNN